MAVSYPSTRRVLNLATEWRGNLLCLKGYSAYTLAAIDDMPGNRFRARNVTTGDTISEGPLKEMVKGRAEQHARSGSLAAIQHLLFVCSPNFGRSVMAGPWNLDTHTLSLCVSKHTEDREDRETGEPFAVKGLMVSAEGEVPPVLQTFGIVDGDPTFFTDSEFYRMLSVLREVVGGLE